jgi:SAM-dependent methyltransferase
MINSLYTNDETFYSSWTEVILNEANQSWQIPYFKSSLDILDKYIESGDLLDIGCSIGLFMEIAQRRGFNCVGLELEKIAYEHAIGKGLNVHRKKLEEAAFSDESFHVITMFGVLEHLPNPKEILIQVRRCLKPGGVVMAIVPNVYSLAAMMLHDKARLFNGRNHLNYFSWKTLPELFDQTGFITQNLDTYLTGLDSILNYIQYSDPNGEPTRKFLPPQIQSVIDNPDPNLNFEQIMYRLNLGLRLRIVATKPE